MSSPNNNAPQGVSERLRVVWPLHWWRRVFSRVARVKANRRFVRYSLLALNLAILAIISVFALRSTQADNVLNKSLSVSPGSDTSAEPLDQLSSADIAVNAAVATGLAETTAVHNQADSVAAELTVAPADTTVVAKPQTVVSAFKSSKDIKTYVVNPGDTVASIAAAFGITSDSVMWSNGLNG